MNTKMIIEGIGYLGSALVLVSFLMVSVRKLRIVNTIGSVIFTVYAFIIKSYPTAIMNLCLVLINLYHLAKMSNTKETTRTYDFVPVSPSDSFFKYSIDRFKDDILKCFPGISLDFSDADTAYIICHDGAPSGLYVGKRVPGEDYIMDTRLDYVTPEYRDFSIGSFLFTNLQKEGIKAVTYSGPDTVNREYLKKYDFVKSGDQYIKTL